MKPQRILRRGGRSGGKGASPSDGSSESEPGASRISNRVPAGRRRSLDLNALLSPRLVLGRRSPRSSSELCGVERDPHRGSGRGTPRSPSGSRGEGSPSSGLVPAESPSSSELSGKDVTPASEVTPALRSRRGHHRALRGSPMTGAPPTQFQVSSETFHNDGTKGPRRQPSGCVAGGAVRAISLFGGRTASRFAGLSGKMGPGLFGGCSHGLRSGRGPERGLLRRRAGCTRTAILEPGCFVASFGPRQRLTEPALRG